MEFVGIAMNIKGTNFVPDESEKLTIFQMFFGFHIDNFRYLTVYYPK